MSPYVVVWLLNSLAGTAIGLGWLARAARAAGRNPRRDGTEARRWLDRGWLAVSGGFTAMELLNLLAVATVLLDGRVPREVPPQLVALVLTLAQDVMIAGVAAMRYFRGRSLRAIERPEP